MITQLIGPRLACLMLPTIATDSAASASEAFAACPPAPMMQGWRAERHPAFRPASVRIGQREGALWVMAELEDADIFNPETRFNEPFYLHGDVFEVFLRPAGQDAYSELHIGPGNQHFQLRIPSAEAFRAASGHEEPWRQWLGNEPMFESWTWLDPEWGRWYVLARIPFTSLSEHPVKPGDVWQYSFSRYDYTRGQPDPVHASTSPHKALSFHRQQEWGELVFP